MNGATRNSLGRDLLLLTCAFGALFLFLLGRAPLANPDEGRYAEIPREMVAGHDWVTPRLDGVPYFEKPPLVYWMVATCLTLFGSSEWSLRLTPAVFGLCGVLATYATARRQHGRTAGLASAITLGTSLLYFALSRLLLLDMAVSVLLSGTLFCFLAAVGEPAGTRRRWLFYGLYALAALATLAKGLIGVLLPGAVMFLWLLAFNQWHRLRPLHLPTGGAIFLAIALPWHLDVAARNPDWARFYFLQEHWQRFTSTMHGRIQPWWFFIPIVLIGLFPWTGFLWSALRRGWVGGWARRKEQADQWFLITWASFVFLFFSMSQSKLVPYILPVFPPLAILIGTEVAGIWASRDATRMSPGLRFFAGISFLLAGLLLVAAFRPGIITDPGQAVALRPYLLLLAAVLAGGSVSALGADQHHHVGWGVGTVIVTMIPFSLILAIATPEIYRPGTKSLAIAARTLIGPQDQVFQYHAFFHDFTYYAARPVGLINYQDELELQFLPEAERASRFIDDSAMRTLWSGPGRVWLVVRERDLKNFAAGVNDHVYALAATPGYSLVSNRDSLAKRAPIQRK